MNDILTNSQRLRTHLAKDGLAAALLAAWEKETGGPEAHARMLTTLLDFHKQKQTTDDQTTAQ